MRTYGFWHGVGAFLVALLLWGFVQAIAVGLAVGGFMTWALVDQSRRGRPGPD